MKESTAGNIEKLGEEKIPILLFKFCLPVVVALLVNALYNLVDRIFIGNSVGPLGIAGITIVYPIMLVMGACATLVGTGGASLISIKLGEKKADVAERVLGNSIVLLVTLAIMVTISGLFFINPILRSFGASSEVLPYAKDYMGIILFGTIFQVFGLGMSYFIRADGSPQKAMATMLIGAIMNIILTPIFIFGFKMGMKGAALATITSQAVSVTWVMYYFLSGNSFLKIHIQNLKLLSSIVKSILAIGAASCLMQITLSLSNMIMNKSLVHYGGDIAVSVMGAIFSIIFLIVLPVLGISQGIQPIIGFNYGAKKFDRVKEALKSGVFAATVIATLGFVITRVFPEELMSLFNSQNKEFITMGSYAMGISMILVPIIGLQIIVSGYFQAIGKPKQAMFLTLSRQVIFIPALLVLPHYFQLVGIFVSIPLSDFLAFVITAIWLLAELKNLNKKQAILQTQSQTL
ncbi:MAG: MATE family efflux transporter [Firmicutes bacterium]|nr:MATE family efflux transporter [Bacillota bacterium]